jgi:predicted nucleotidyltransferase
VAEHHEAIASLCRELHVERLDLFGSATRPDFGSKSDVDVLVLFDRRRGQLFNRYFELKEGLERIFNRPVDVVLDDSVRNPYLRQAIDRKRIKVYGS